MSRNLVCDLKCSPNQDNQTTIESELNKKDFIIIPHNSSDYPGDFCLQDMDKSDDNLNCIVAQTIETELDGSTNSSSIISSINNSSLSNQSDGTERNSVGDPWEDRVPSFVSNLAPESVSASRERLLSDQDTSPITSLPPGTMQEPPLSVSRYHYLLTVVYGIGVLFLVAGSL